MTSRKNTIALVTSEEKGQIFIDLDGKVDIEQGVENAGKILCVGDDGNVSLKNEVIPVASQSSEKIPLFVSMMPDFFWVSSNEIAAFSASLAKYTEGTEAAENNAWFKITGNQGDSYVTIISGGNGDVADITASEKEIPFGCVIMYDDGNYYPCNAQYLTDTTFSVYPPLKEDITAGELAQIRTGIHLSRRGYRAYSQFLYRQDPKYCVKEKKLAVWNPDTDVQDVPFTPFGHSRMVQYAIVTSNNQDSNYIDRLRQPVWIINYSDVWDTTYYSDEPTGMEWTVDVGNHNGYVELFLSIKGNSTNLYELDATDSGGYESGLIIELIEDGVATTHIVKKTKPLERIILPFSGKGDTTVRAYFPHIRTLALGMRISRIAWWVTDGNAPDKIIPTGSVVGQLFDSWGTFHDAESAVYLHNLINADATVTVPYFNGSLGGQTSAWGKAWFYNKMWENNPSVVLTNFGVNDAISTTGLPSFDETVAGPDGTIYDNIIEVEDYITNMSVIIDEALSNDITPVIVDVALPFYQERPIALLDAHSELVT